MIAKLLGWLDSQSRFDLCCQLALIAMLSIAPSQTSIRAVLAALAIVGLIAPQIRASQVYWFGICMFYFAGILLNWRWLDNHVWLFGYLCLVLLLGRAEPKQSEWTLETNARWMLGLCMAFAVIWKLRTGEFMSGEFFSLTLIADSRFFGVTALLTGMPLEDLRANDRLMELARNEALPSIELNSNPYVKPLSVVFAYWTIAIESAIALAYLCPKRFRMSHLRVWLLLAFIVSTYWIAPVKGFGWTLAILGLASSEKPLHKGLFLGGFILVQLYQIDYETVLSLAGAI